MILRFFYTLLIRCAVPFAYALVLWRSVGDRGYRVGLAQRFGFGPRVATPGIWVHAVSLGEMSAAAPLLRALRSRHPAIPLVVTTATPAGRERAQTLLGAGGDVRFLPYDTPGAVRRFLARIRPSAAIIMETELWPNLLRECRRRRIPVLLASARLSAKSAARYLRFASLFSEVFTGDLLVAAQTESDAERFRSIGAAAAQVEVAGNVKFDMEWEPHVLQEGLDLRVRYGAGRPVWIAGSTHAGEDEQMLDAHALLRARRADALLLLAPRHKDRFAAVADLLVRRGIKYSSRCHMNASTAAPVAVPLDASVLLVDTVGELAALYASADIAFVGGSLVPIGGHNLLEPAALGLPVLTGPSYFNSNEIAQLLLARGAAMQVGNAQELARALLHLLDAAAERKRIGDIGKEIVAANRGSVQRLLSLIEPWLPGRRP